jgi:peptidoglycan hydrolase-like protein with peptidoglycan-binding domain
VSFLKQHRTAVIVAVAVVVAAVVAGVLLIDRGGKSSTTTTTTTTSSGTTTTATDPAVADLQRVMTRLGYYTGPIDGVYGPATTAAVTQIQKALGVTADGVYGPATAVALRGKGKDVVVQIQTELAKYGYYTGPIDGNYGSDTKAAVTKLQNDLGLAADGLVGAETIAAFNKAVADGTLKPTTTTSTTAAVTTTTSVTTTTAATTTTTGTTTRP